MKKKILFSLLSLVVCMFTMTACSNDDDNNNGGGASGLKLTSVDWGDEVNGKCSYIYDEQGRIKKLSYSARKDAYSATYDYQSNKIIVTTEGTYNGYWKNITEYTLKDGVITDGVVTDDEGEVIEKDEFSYKDGQLVSVMEKEVGENGDTYEISINWKDGNIESYVSKRSRNSFSEQWQTTCQYTSESAVKGLVVCYTGIGFAFFEEKEDILFKLGYFGKQPKYLLSAIHKFSEQLRNDENGNTYTYREERDQTYSYGFEGKDGYVSSRTVTEKNINFGEKEKTYVEKYTWE